MRDRQQAKCFNVRIRQHASFRVGSGELNPDEITALLLIEPDRVGWRGSRSKEPCIPATNLWSVQSRLKGRVDEMVRDLVDRFEPLRTPLDQLRAAKDSWIVISVGRHFDVDDGDAEHLDVNDDFEKVPGQHQLLGFHLDVDLLVRLTRMGCAVDFDEYG